jgi:thiol-disulfide isomerase/thioredoxin
MWASWCGPCVAEWPDPADFLREAAARPLDVITLALDEPAGAAAAAKVLASSGPVPGRALRASPDIALPVLKAADPDWVGAIPTTLILDHDGKIVFAQRGFTRLRQLQQEIDRLAPKERRSP